MLLWITRLDLERVQTVGRRKSSEVPSSGTLKVTAADCRFPTDFLATLIGIRDG